MDVWQDAQTEIRLTLFTVSSCAPLPEVIVVKSIYRIRSRLLPAVQHWEADTLDQGLELH